MSLTPPGYAPSSPSRHRGRPRGLVVLAVVVVLVLIAGGAFAFVLNQQAAAARKADRHARDAAAEYLTAWSALDAVPAAGSATTGQTGTSQGGFDQTKDASAQTRVRLALATGPSTVAAVLDSMTASRAKLQISKASYAPGATHRTGSTGTTPYTASLTLVGLPEPFTWSGTLNLVKVNGQWKVAASLDSVYPGLTAGQHVGRIGSTAARGNLLDANGAQLSDDPDLSGNLVGRSNPPTGLQRVYNAQLTPTGGAVVVATAAGQVVRTVKTYDMADGKDVTTTLDLTVQHAGENALEPLRATGKLGALVAIDTRTGGVLALVNEPSSGIGRAVRGTYPPGSTFKIITSTAALMSGKTAATPLSCTQKVTVSGHTFQNAEAEQFGTISLHDAFAKSCNTAFINLERSLPGGAMSRAAALYGFNAGSPLPISSVGGSYPATTDPVAAAASAIGQAQVTASPLQMASVAAAVASGTWRQPFVTGTAAKTSHVLPAGVAPTLRTFMRSVVTTGTAAGVQFPGIVYGKTGTAEYGTDNPPKTDAWFVGYRGNVAFAVIVEDGGFGADTAAPAAARFLAALPNS